jgi:hypothetical protein
MATAKQFRNHTLCVQHEALLVCPALVLQDLETFLQINNLDAAYRDWFSEKTQQNEVAQYFGYQPCPTSYRSVHSPSKWQGFGLLSLPALLEHS